MMDTPFNTGDFSGSPYKFKAGPIAKITIHTKLGALVYGLGQVKDNRIISKILWDSDLRGFHLIEGDKIITTIGVGNNSFKIEYNTTTQEEFKKELTEEDLKVGRFMFSTEKAGNCYEILGIEKDEVKLKPYSDYGDTYGGLNFTMKISAVLLDLKEDLASFQYKDNIEVGDQIHYTPSDAPKGMYVVEKVDHNRIKLVYYTDTSDPAYNYELNYDELLVDLSTGKAVMSKKYNYLIEKHKNQPPL